MFVGLDVSMFKQECPHNLTCRLGKYSQSALQTVKDSC
jgi:hypothetical protein